MANQLEQRSQLELRDWLRTNRQADGTMSKADVDARLAELDGQLGEGHDVKPPDAGQLGGLDRPQAARGDEAGPGSARPGKGSVDLTPGRDALPGTPPTDMENPNIPTGGPVGDNTPAPGVGGVPNKPGTRRPT